MAYHPTHMQYKTIEGWNSTKTLADLEAELNALTEEGWMVQGVASDYIVLCRIDFEAMNAQTQAMLAEQEAKEPILLTENGNHYNQQ